MHGNAEVTLFKLALALWLVYNVGVYAWRRRRALLARQSAGARRHDRSGVDVPMPYDAKDFLQPHNTAEVVLTEQFAVVSVGDASLVHYRESLSIDAEVVRFPHKPARSMKGSGVTATAALFFALIGYRHVGVGVGRARAPVAGPSAPAAVQAAPASVAAPAPGEDDAASAPAAPSCARGGCDAAHWAAIRAGVASRHCICPG